MPKEKEISHPCHLLSLPSARRFWCRHCMTVFEDAITRWRHSRSCRYGVVNNFMRRRELEAKALQNTTVLNPVEARLEQSIQMCDLASVSVPGEPDSSNQSPVLSGPESFNCFICHQKFASMEEMRIHVKYPCSNSKIVTTHVPHPKHSVPVFIDSLPGQTGQWQLPSQHSQDEMHSTTTFVQASNPQQISAQSFDIEIQSQQEVVPQYVDTEVAYDHGGSAASDSITPTNIYVNEQGETVIEVENLDLNSEGGELSLAHLLTQLSQQGIVFDKTRAAQLQTQSEIIVSGGSTNTLYTTDAAYQHSAVGSKIEDEEEQPTAEDAANTLAQLAGFRGFSRTGQTQAGGESHLHHHPQGLQRYSSCSSSSGASSHYATSTHTQIDIKYDYEYSDPLSACEHSVFTAQQVHAHQASLSASQENENVKVEPEAAGESVQFYSDSSSVTYITDPAGNQVQLDSSAGSDNDDLRQGSVGDAATDTVLIQHYPIQLNRSGQLTIVPSLTSAQQIHESQEIILSSTHGTKILSANIEADISTHCQESAEPSIVEQGSVAENQISVGADEFATQTVILQDIVDSIK